MKTSIQINLYIPGVARLFCLRAKFHQDIVLRAAKILFCLVFNFFDIIDVNFGSFSYINLSSIVK